MSDAPSEHTANAVRRARSFIVVMGVVAMFGDMTYEGARGLAGPYLGLLGVSATVVGFVAGLGEFLGYALRLVTGWLADRLRAWWPLVIAGYAINLVAVPKLALAGHWQVAIVLVLLERVGKAIRSPARSTIVSYAASAAGVGRSFGIEEALDQIGAVAGPLLTALAIWLARDALPAAQMRMAFAVLLLPAAANLVLVVLARRRYPTPAEFEPDATVAHPQLGRLFRWYIFAAALIGLGFADWVLIAYHAAKCGLVDTIAFPLLYAAVMAVDGLAALLLGRLFDRAGLRVLAVAVLISACFAPFAFLLPSTGLLVAGAGLWAIGMGAQDSIFKAAIVGLVPKQERARAYGVFFAVFGLAWWIGSTTMGWLYERSTLALVVFSVATQLAAVPVLLILANRISRMAPPS